MRISPRVVTEIISRAGFEDLSGLGWRGTYVFSKKIRRTRA